MQRIALTRGSADLDQPRQSATRWMAPHQLRIAPDLTARDICYWQIFVAKVFLG
jgi:hypothetical protein